MWLPSTGLLLFCCSFLTSSLGSFSLLFLALLCPSLPTHTPANLPVVSTPFLLHTLLPALLVLMSFLWPFGSSEPTPPAPKSDQPPSAASSTTASPVETSLPRTSSIDSHSSSLLSTTPPPPESSEASAPFAASVPPSTPSVAPSASASASAGMGKGGAGAGAGSGSGSGAGVGPVLSPETQNAVVPPSASIPMAASFKSSSTMEDWVVPGGEEPLMRGAESGCWDDPDATMFKLRSKSYLTSKVKNPSKSAAYKLVGVQCFASKAPILHTAEKLPQLRSFLDRATAGSSSSSSSATATSPDTVPDPTRFCIVVFNLPGKPIVNVVYLFARQIERGEDPEFDGLLDQYVRGTDEFRNSRFKLLAKMEKAPWVVGTAASRLGIERPAILGRKLNVAHYTGANYFEQDVDVGSSKIASAIHGLILRACSSIVVVTAFTFEGQSEDELPERIMGAVRFREIPLAKYLIDMTDTL